MIIECVTDFINDFKSMSKDLEYVFTNGYCYYFAVMLCERFKDLNPYICYLPIENHFCVCINHEYYDITGLIQPSEEIYEWSVYQNIDNIHSARIIKQCIKKDERS